MSLYGLRHKTPSRAKRSGKESMRGNHRPNTNDKGRNLNKKVNAIRTFEQKKPFIAANGRQNYNKEALIYRESGVFYKCFLAKVLIIIILKYSVAKNNRFRTEKTPDRPAEEPQPRFLYRVIYGSNPRTGRNALASPDDARTQPTEGAKPLPFRWP